GTKIDVPALQMIPDQCRHSGKRQRRLRNIVSRIRLDLRGKCFALLESGMRADEHAISASFVGSLYDQLVEIFQNVLAVLVAKAKECWDIGQDRIFSEI